MKQRLVPVLLLMALPALGGPGNLVPNGDFEAGGQDEGKAPAEWVSMFDPGVLSTSAKTRPGSPGARGLKIGTTEEKRRGGVKTGLIPLDPKKPLRVLGHFRDGGSMETRSNPYIAVAWFGADGKKLETGSRTNYTYINSRKKPEWQCFSHTFLPVTGKNPYDRYRNVPPDAAFFQMWLMLLNYPGPVWFDDIEASQETAPDHGRLKQTTGVEPSAKASSEFDYVVNWTGALDREHGFTVRFAGDELAGYLSRVTGKRVPSVPLGISGRKTTFLITDAAHAPTEIAERLTGTARDAFLIKYPCFVEGRKVCLIVSHDRYSYDFPVYWFLSKYADVHWLGPGALGEIVPRKTDWTMPDAIDVVENPDLEMRYWVVPGFDGRKWLAGSMRYDFHHAFSKVFDPKQYGDQPDLYPLVDGKRYIPDPKDRHKLLSGWQPCIGNPKAVDIATRYGLDLLAKSPRFLSFSLSVNDGRLGQCECARCWAMDSERAFDQLEPDFSDRYFRFYNKVIERVVARNPDAYLAVLGYGNSTTKPPNEVRVRPRTIVFMVDRIDPAYAAAGAIPALYQNLMDHGYLTVRHTPRAHARILRKLKSLGGVAYYAGVRTFWAAHAPSYYALGHLLWNANGDVDALLDRFMRLAYGKEAAPHMRTYFDRWESVFDRDTADCPAHARDSLFWVDWLKPPLSGLDRKDLAAMDGALAAAEASTMLPDQKKRFDLCDAYYRLLRAAAAQALAAREFGDPQWVARQDAEALFGELAQSLRARDAFDRVAKGRVYGDKTGWLVPPHQRKSPERCLGHTLGLRRMIASLHETSMDKAVADWSERQLKDRRKAEVLATLEDQAKRHPELEPFIQPQIDSLNGVERKNLVQNPSFEEALPGRPDRIKYWNYSPDPKQATSAKPCRYAWEDNSGRNGGRAPGIGGPSLFAGLSSGVPVEPGRRYRFSFWYKTVGRKYTCNISLSMKNQPISFYVPPTHGAWRQVTRTFTVREGDRVGLLLRSGWQYRRCWTYFDDVEIVKIW